MKWERENEIQCGKDLTQCLSFGFIMLYEVLLQSTQKFEMTVNQLPMIVTIKETKFHNL